MKKITLLLAILFSISLTSQELYWYDVIVKVEGEDVVEFEKSVDKFYSSVDFPDDVTMTFSAIPLKGKGTTTFFNLLEEDNGPHIDNWRYRHDVLYDPFDKTKKEKLQIEDKIEITQPTILRVSYPHSVTVIESPRITYHVKLLRCKYDLNTVAKKLEMLG